MIKPWPNTYTFTKSLAERYLKKNRGNIPVMIVRPSIILAAYKEPLPEWTDQMAAAGPLTLMYCLGVINYAGPYQTNRADMIPVDYVSNSIIVNTVF